MVLHSRWIISDILRNNFPTWRRNNAYVLLGITAEFAAPTIVDFFAVPLLLMLRSVVIVVWSFAAPSHYAEGLSWGFVLAATEKLRWHIDCRAGLVHFLTERGAESHLESVTWLLLHILLYLFVLKRGITITPFHVLVHMPLSRSFHSLFSCGLSFTCISIGLIRYIIHNVFKIIALRLLPLRNKPAMRGVRKIRVVSLDRIWHIR